MSRIAKLQGRRYDGAVLKVKVNKILDLPKIRQQEEQFQSLLTSFDSNDSNLSFREYIEKSHNITSNERSISNNPPINNRSLSNGRCGRSPSKLSFHGRKSPEQQNIYGLQRHQTEREFKQPLSRKNSFKQQIEREFRMKDEQTSEEWMEHCKQIEAPHGQVQFYDQCTQQYQWVDVAILEYDSAATKFIVQKHPNGPIKNVGRWSIKFKEQNEGIFQIASKAKQQEQSDIKSERRIVRELNLIQNQNVNEMSSALRQKLFKKFIYFRKFNLINQLLDEANQQYVFAMKKCSHLKSLDCYKPKFTPIRGDSKFKKNRKIIKKESCTHKSKVISMNEIFINRLNSFSLSTFQLQNMKLPMAIEILDQYIQNQFIEIKANFKKQRYYLITDIQDNLQHEYNFFTVDYAIYLQSGLKRVCVKLDLIYANYLFEVLYSEQVKLLEFYQRFQRKQQAANIIPQALLVLEIQVMSKDKSAKQTRSRFTSYRHSIQLIEDNEPIQLFPPLNQIIEVLCRPNTLLLETILNINKLETQLLPLLLLKPQFSIESLCLDEVYTIEQSIIDLIESEYQLCQDIVTQFQQYQYIMQPMKTKVINRIFGIENKEKPLLSQLKADYIRQQLQQVVDAKWEISVLVLDEVNLGLFRLACSKIKKILMEKATDNYNSIMNKLLELLKFNMGVLKQEYQQMYNQTESIPQNEQQLIEIKLFLDQIKTIFGKFNQEVNLIEFYFKLFEEFYYTIDTNILQEYYALKAWPADIKQSIRTNKKQLEICEKQFLAKLDHDKADFTEKFLKIQELFAEIKQFNSYNKVKTQVMCAKQLQESFEQLHEMVNSFNQREILFKLPQTQYHEMNTLFIESKPYQQLWDLAGEFELQKEMWLFGSFKALNFQVVQLKIAQFVNETITISTHFKQIQDEYAQTVTREFRRALDQFKQNLWVVEALAIESFSKKPSLWRELFKECKIQNFDPKEDFSLQTLISRGILNVKDQVQALSQRAEKGWTIEKRLNEMQEKLTSIDLELSPYRETFIFKNFEEVQSQFDEQLNVLIMLKAQQHVRMVIGKANQLDAKIVLIQDTLDFGMKCQKTWMYLDPIFGSDDIKQKLKKETKDFQKVDQSFRNCMMTLNLNKNLWDCIENDKIKIEFQQDVIMLDQVQKSLSKYLEQKRVFFPRFYFVSDEELIEILAQTKDPTQIQKHIFKCFEGIHELDFQNNHIIRSILSHQKEKVPLINVVDVNKGSKLGNVEQWLFELQTSMRNTIREIMKDTLKDLNSSKLDFISAWPSQCILLVNNIKFTRNTESALRGQHKLTLTKFRDMLDKDLQDTVMLVRSCTNTLQKLTLESMVVMEVHAKDIITSLINSKVQSIQDFAWISQLRYYYDPDEDNDKKVQVKMVNASFNYGFEYLGTTTRLVITQLTERCYRTLMEALHMNYGGAPEGPAGTGKSETVKDLAKALAMQCIVFNCSDGLNYIAMGKFFKGLASSGAWCCFDEFNRIDPEVLSVVAQQIFTIQKAIKENRKSFYFEGEEINLIETCAINVTMNPGYTGRSELPDNLKILFRPCAMMVPDYQMIAEIHLYSIGFEKARELSAKIVACLRLCNEQLSPQEHYDFGMRTLKAILNTAKTMVDVKEEQICLTAIINVNKPKFVQQDIELFMSITSDLFPTVCALEQQQLDLYDVCLELNLQLDNTFIEKCHHLYHTIRVRNGVMCIGQAFTGKSTVINTLAKNMDANVYKLNPKAVTSDQLYGRLDPDSKQWSDGIIPILIRENILKTQLVWISFDGPVDSIWIENLNTVLDDNKKLCLTSGEILKIPNTMSMVFEVEDLSAASPATISRCGMVHFPQLDWYIQVQSFITPKFLDQDYFTRRLRFLLDHTIAWCAQFAIYPVYDNINIMVCNYLKLLTSCLLNVAEDIQPHCIDSYIIFSLIWSLGATLDEKCRKQFNYFLNRLLNTNTSGLQTKYPMDVAIKFQVAEECDYYSMAFINQTWIKWIDTQSKYIVNPELQFHEITIPTSESIRNDYFCSIGLHFLFSGPTGTGKSLSMQKYSKYTITCSGQTTANQIQRLIEAKINKRRRKGYYGNEEGHIIIFIDDLNMPFREVQGAQPAIELLRQWMDQGGWYDLETKEFKYMCDITFLGAIQPASGGRNAVSLRYLRYFNLLYISGFDAESITYILSTMMEWIIMRLQPIHEIVQLKQLIVNNTLLVFEKIQQLLLPTPAKSHYVYNLRDIFKVFLGMSKATKLSSGLHAQRLWMHECIRVFSDRLICEEDEQIFENILKDCNYTVGYSVTGCYNIVWVPFLNNNTYEEVQEFGVIKSKLVQLLEEYNTMMAQHRLNLILFANAIRHICKIVRIVSQTYGHALLVGMGGSGRTSLSKLSAYIALGQNISTIDPRYWDEQMLTIMKDVGLEETKTTLLFNDSQFVEEYMLEDVCNLLSHGEISHLFPPEERIKIQEEMGYNEFVKNCRLNIHVILCMQPVGEIFRKRLRMFPTIINCTTIDWFNRWPEEALESTATSFLPSNLVKVAVETYYKVLEITDRYQQELRRHFYVTPTQYLQFLQTYQKLRTSKLEQTRISIDRYETGIEKIIKTEKDVDQIRQVLFDLQPKLDKATMDNMMMLKNLKKQQVEANQRKQQCEVEEMECSMKREEANTLRNICQAQLNNVLPLLSQATEALEKITRDDMILLKSFQNPPPSAAVVMEGLCYAFQEDGNVKPKNDKEALKSQDFWDYAKKFLLNDKLIKRIKLMKIDAIRAIHPSKIAKLQVFIQNPLFEREKVFNASMAAGNLAEWVRAVLATYEAIEIIEPKKAELAEAEIKLSEAEEVVKLKRITLEESLQIVATLSLEYEKIRKDKEEIEKQVTNIQAQLTRAEKLTNGLSEEKVRWRKKAQNFKSEQHSIEGDCLLSSAIIAYLGVFPIQYRDLCIDTWKLRLKQIKVQISENYSIQKQLCDPVTINQWIHQKLPNDQFSIDNAIILKQSTRWPLMIDPQMQANEWIKNMEDRKTLLIINPTQLNSQVQLQLEHAIQIGYSVLLENITEKIDSMYAPILQQKIIRKSNKLMINFNDKPIDYSPDFKFYMTTKLNNPHYQPQICVMVTMLNFETTLEGLSDQMLNIVVKSDEPVKEEQRIKNIQQYFINKNMQQLTEDQILKLLYEAEGNLLENEALIDTLHKSKEEGQEIEERLKKQEYDHQLFSSIRQFYRAQSTIVANLFFVVNDLSMVEPTYLWSLEFYITLYQKSIKEAAFGKARRCQNIIDKFTNLLYVTVNRSLLEKDKLIFRFLLCTKLLDIPIQQIRTCCMGPTITETDIPMPDYPWLTKKMWLGLVDIQLKFNNIFGWICDDLINNKQFWDQLYYSPTPYNIQIRELTQFQVNMIIKIIKPDKFIWSIHEMIKNHMGKFYLESQPFNLETFYQESSCLIPLLCVITPGADPRQEILSLAEKYNFQDKFNQISLGQGQVQTAIKYIKQGMIHGRWILLQNCHVANTFMPELELLYEQLNKKEVNKEFRLWLTSLPTNLLPQNVILRALKMTYELPRGIKNNMLRSYAQENSDQFEDCKRVKEWKNLYFSLCLFHSCILERKKFGALGWNIPYNFSAHDLVISKEQLKQLLELTNDIQWDAVHYFVAEANYGGRVTDPVDRRLLRTLLQDFMKPAVIGSGYSFYENYNMPEETNLKGYIDYISQISINDPPQLFGLHQNAEIYSAIIDANNLSTSVLSLLPRSVGSAKFNPDYVVAQKTKEILRQLPPTFNLQKIDDSYPLLSNNSLNTVLQQELVRYNKLLLTLQSTLTQLQKALDGLISMSDNSQEIYNKIFDNQVPHIWSKVSYPSMKPLGAWIIDLLERLKFMQKWINEGQPHCYWMGGFFFIQSFITGNLQNHSRKSQIAIDQLKFDFKFQSERPLEKPQDGFFVEGLQIDGARFDTTTQALEEPESNVLFYQAPYLLFLPTTKPSTLPHYLCPLYNTADRNGRLSSNGYSMNFISDVKIPINKPEAHWIKRGVAMIVQLD